MAEVTLLNPEEYEVVEDTKVELLDPSEYEVAEEATEAPQQDETIDEPTQVINQDEFITPQDTTTTMTLPEVEQSNKQLQENIDTIKGTGEEYENPTAPEGNLVAKWANRSNEVIANSARMYQALVDEATDGENEKVFGKLGNWIDKDKLPEKDVHTPEEVKKAFKAGGVFDIDSWQEVGNYIAETGVQSIGDMQVMLGNAPTWIAGFGYETAEERAKNDGREKPNKEDLAIGTATATAEYLMEMFGLKGMTKDVVADISKEVLKSGLKETTKKLAKSVGKGTLKEGGTEAFQEGVLEPTGERAGTKTDKPLIDEERAFWGGLAGAGAGGAVSTATGIGTEIKERIAPSDKQEVDEFGAKITDPITEEEKQELYKDEYNRKFAEAIGVIEKDMPDLPQEEKEEIAHRATQHLEDEIQANIQERIKNLDEPTQTAKEVAIDEGKKIAEEQKTDEDFEVDDYEPTTTAEKYAVEKYKEFKTDDEPMSNLSEQIEKLAKAPERLDELAKKAEDGTITDDEYNELIDLYESPEMQDYLDFEESTEQQEVNEPAAETEAEVELLPKDEYEVDSGVGVLTTSDVRELEAENEVSKYEQKGLEDGKKLDPRSADDIRINIENNVGKEEAQEYIDAYNKVQDEKFKEYEANKKENADKEETKSTNSEALIPTKKKTPQHILDELATNEQMFYDSEDELKEVNKNIFKKKNTDKHSGLSKKDIEYIDKQYYKDNENKVKRYEELTENLFDGTLTDNENKEMEQLEDDLGDFLVKYQETKLKETTDEKHSKKLHKDETKEKATNEKEATQSGVELYSNPIHLIGKSFLDATEALTNIVNKLNDIVSKNITDLEGTKFDKWFRKIGGSEAGLGLLSREQEKKFVKLYQKLQSALSMSNISAEAKADLIENARGDIQEELFNEGVIRYLENPEVRENIKKEFPDLAKELDKIRKYIDELSEDAMNRGLIKPSQFDKWKGRYLSRLYIAREALGLTSSSSGIKIGDIASGRKIDSIVDYLKENPEEAKRLGAVLDPIAMIKQTIAKTQSNIGYEAFLRGVIDFGGLVNKELLVKLKEPINALPSVFSPSYADKVIIPYIKDMLHSVRRKAILREFGKLSAEDKKIVDAVMQSKKFDRKLYKKYNELFKKYDILNESEKAEVQKYSDIIDDLKDQRDAIKAVLDKIENTKEMTKLPESQRYGALSGLPVTSDVASLIKSQINIARSPEMFADRADKALSFTLGYLKWAWVPGNIFSYPRNYFSNLFQWTMGGSNPLRFPTYTAKAVWSFIKKDKYYKIAKEQGVIDTNIVSQEINQLLKENEQNPDALFEKVKSGMRNIGGAFGWIDDMVKVAQIAYQMEQRGKTAEEAVEKAQSIHYDYTLTYDAIRRMRDPSINEGVTLKLLGTLFPTYTQKTIAFLYDTVQHRPVTLLLMGAALALAFGVDDDDKEELEKRYGRAKARKMIDEIEKDKPEWMQYNPLVKTNIKTAKNGKIKVIYTDFSYSIPFGTLLTAMNAMAHGHPIESAKGMGLGSNPIQMFGDILTNRDSFTKKDIYYEYDAKEATKDIAKWAGKNFLPGTITKIMNLLETRHPVAPRLVGINQYEYSKDELKIWSQYSAVEAINKAKLRTKFYVRKIQQAEEDYSEGKISKKKKDAIIDENTAEIRRWIEIGKRAYLEKKNK